MKNFNKIIMLILSINFLLSLYSVFLLSRCDLGSTYDCLLSKEGFFADFYYHYNTLKYTGVHGIFPSIEIPNDVDGGFDGASIYGKDNRIIYHAPIYYYLSGFVYVLAKSININDLLALHIFSIVIFLFTNILFFFLVRKISKYFSKNGQKFIIYSLVIFIVLPTPLHASLAIQSDGLFYLSVIASFLVYLHFLENKTAKNALFLGLIVGLSLLTRLVGIIVLFALLFYIVKLHFEKKRESRNLVCFSFVIAFILGLIPFVRNYILTGYIYGDMLARGVALHNLPKLLYKVYTCTSAFWAGIAGGLPHLKPLLFLISILLTSLALIGLVLYFKEMRKKVDLDFIILTYIFTAIFLVAYMCSPIIFLKTGLCYGRGIQNRYVLSLAPMIPLFSAIALIKIQDKKPYLKYFIYIFLSLACLVFIVDFISALI